MDHQELDKEGLSTMDVAVINLDDSDLEGTLEVRKVQDHPQLKDLLHAPKTLPDPRGGTILVLIWLHETHIYLKFARKRLNQNLAPLLCDEFYIFERWNSQ